jgi:hypothetical protein
MADFAAAALCKCGNKVTKFYDEDICRTCHVCHAWYMKTLWGWDITDYHDTNIGDNGWLKLTRNVPVDAKHMLLENKVYKILLVSVDKFDRELFWIRGKVGELVAIQKKEFIKCLAPIKLNLRR